MNVIYRTCSAVSQKPRPPWFSKEKCFRNFWQVFGDWPKHQCHIVVDSKDDRAPDWIFRNWWDTMKYVKVHENHNARAFLKALDYACTLEGDLYLVEDDFLHRPGAPEVLADGLNHFDYTTAYDHFDKWVPGHIGYETEKEINARPVLGKWCHYKSTCSTVMTFAVKAETLQEDADVWRKWSQGDWTQDHRAFCELTARGRTVGSSIPAYATHCEPRWLAPLVDWEAVSSG